LKKTLERKIKKGGVAGYPHARKEGGKKRDKGGRALKGDTGTEGSCVRKGLITVFSC